MITDITKLNKKNWQHKRNTIGEVVQGSDDIKQCIETIMTTDKGSVPFMPELGTNVIEAIGENSEDAINIAIAIYKKEIPLQEPRCAITDITGVCDDNGHIHITVYYKEKSTGYTDKVERYI